MLSFKIGKLFYKYSFYLIDILEDFKFGAILGFHFLQIHRVIIDLQNNPIKINCNLRDILDSVLAQEVSETQDLKVNAISQQDFFYS